MIKLHRWRKIQKPPKWNKVIENLKIEVQNVKKTPVPTTKELIGPILDTVNTSIKQSISVALEPVINNQIQSECRVNNLFSDLEAQVSQVLNQNTTNQHSKCELCRRTFPNQQSLENHIRTNHRPNQTQYSRILASLINTVNIQHLKIIIVVACCLKILHRGGQ